MSEQIIYGGSVSQLAPTTTEYLGAIGGGTLLTVIDRARIPFPADGTISDFYAWLSAAPGTGDSRLLSIEGCSSGTPSITISNTDTEGSDTSTSADVQPGDEIYIRSSYTGTPAAAYLRVSYKWTPDTAGEHILGGLTESTQLSTTGGQYLSAAGAGPAPYSSEESAWIYLPVPCDCYDFYVHLTTGPGVGNKDRRLTLRKNGSNQAGTNLTISSLNTTGNNTGNTVSYSAGDYLSYRSTLADFGDPAPNASYIGFSFVCKCTDTDYFLVANNGSSFLPTGSTTYYRQAQTGGNAWNASTTGRAFLTQEMFIDRAYFKIRLAPSSGSWSTSWYNISGEPNVTFTSTSGIGLLAVAPKRQGADRLFAHNVHSYSIPASYPDNQVSMSCCYACKTVLPVRSAPFMF